MSFLRSEKADAEVVGHIIILALTMTGIAMITLVGVPTIYKLQDMANVRNVEQSYTVMDSRVSKVALGEAPLQIIDVNLRGGNLFVEPNSSTNPSYILFELREGANRTTIPIPMGKIVYKLGEREVAYEGGAVWTKYPEGSVMLSPPEFNYNGVTLTLPIVNISGNSSAGGKGASSLKIKRKGDTQIIYPSATDPNRTNPIPDGSTIDITIKSEFYDGWADFFEDVPLAKVTEVPSDKKVVITLEGTPLITNFSYGALASKKIVIGAGALIDSYNSSIGKYPDSVSSNGSIRATQLIEMSNGAEVKGSALTGGDITGKGTITGDACANSVSPLITVNGDDDCPAVAGYSVGSTSNLVQNKRDEYKATNNNNDPSAGGCLAGVNNTEFDSDNWGTDTCTISTGDYYLTKFILQNNDVLIFDTASGPVNIAIDSYDLDIRKGNITVGSFNDPVRIYLNEDIEIQNNAVININSNHKSSLFQVISSSTNDIDLSNSADFCGFIWAPEAEIDIGNMNMYGAIVGKEFDLHNNEEMHFDEDLQNLNTDVGSGTIMTYLYISSNDLEVGAN